MDLKALQDTPPWEWPEDTGTKLLAILRDSKAAAADRRLAAELAGDFPGFDDDLALALTAIVRGEEESAAMRAAAAIALGPALEQADTEGFDDAVSEPPIGEPTFRKVQETLRDVHANAGADGDVRRAALEASVRAPQDWHRDAVRGAWSSEDIAWKRTAAFCMQYVRGFEAQILEALRSRDLEIQYEALVAAGNWEVDAAWPRVVELVNSEQTDKPLRLAAIEAAGSIRPQEAPELLGDLLDSDDEDIVEAAGDAMDMAEAASSDEDEDDDEDDDKFSR